MFSLQAMAFLLMPTLAVGSFVVFCGLSMVVMSCYGGGYGTISAVVGTYYDARGLGAGYGSVFTAWRSRKFRCASHPGAIRGRPRLLLSSPLRDGGVDGSRCHDHLGGQAA